MNDLDHARSRRLDAAIHESLGESIPEDLGPRLLLRLRHAPTRPRRRAAWIAAAGLLLGSLAVLAVALHEGTERQDPGPSREQSQDPRPRVVVQIDTKAVRAAFTPVQNPAPGAGPERLLKLAGEARRCLVLGAGVQGRSKADLTGLSFEEAVHRVAAELSCGVEDHGGVLLVAPGLRRRASATTRIRLQAKAMPLRELLQQLHQRCGLDLVLAREARGHLQLDVEDVPWRTLLELAADKLGLQVQGCGDVLAIHPRRPRPRPRPSIFRATDQELKKILSTRAKILGENLIIDPRVQGRLSLSTWQAPLADLLRAQCRAVGAEPEVLDERGITTIRPALAEAPRTRIATRATTLRELAKTLAPRFELALADTLPAAPVELLCAEVRIKDLWLAAAQVRGLQLHRRGGKFCLE